VCFNSSSSVRAQAVATLGVAAVGVRSSQVQGGLTATPDNGGLGAPQAHSQLQRECEAQARPRAWPFQGLAAYY
jgi:hypothetical protein